MVLLRWDSRKRNLNNQNSINPSSDGRANALKAYEGHAKGQDSRHELLKLLQWPSDFINSFND